ncbi:proton-conducting transporter membrane subunit [Ferrimonas balearica]|uniref:proton-conducting transporter transmembrane domain-containing protein n=1 Tax=Ferrimonas balearica TaxID=44012 RepID=UPI001C993656|nr:proton-conducting transporter membrane subunit [Ferrimonas balearica]MBY5991208.1 monovalent cation/H+ antiporter subunit D family protein [Ferrimonas balearica]
MSPLLIILLLPWLTALGIVLTGRWPNLRDGLALIAGAVLFALVTLLYPLGVGVEALSGPSAFPGLPIAFSVEPLGLLFALVAAGLWPVTTLYAIGYMRSHNEHNQTRFYACFAIAIGGVMGVAFADNLLTLFIFYEVLTLSTYPLVTHAGTDKARKGGRTYLGLLLFTSIAFFLLAMLGTYALVGHLDFRAGGVFDDGVGQGVLGLLLLLYLFGIGKAALMPFHRWLPAAMVAPTPVSALLHAVAVVKAGVFSVLKVVVYLFGVETVAQLAVTPYLLYLAAASVLLASLVAMRQDNLKKRLAYSTVSQLGYVTIGALLATQAGVVAGAMQIAAHAFGKITLFFCAGAILVASHKTEVSQLGGLGRRMPLTMTAFLIGSLSIIGLPPTGGTWSKWLLVAGALDTAQWALVAVLMLSTLLNIGYLLPIPVRAFWGKSPGEDTPREGGEAPWPALLALLLTAGATLWLFFFPDVLFELARAAAPGAGGDHGP